MPHKIGKMAMRKTTSDADHKSKFKLDLRHYQGD